MLSKFKSKLFSARGVFGGGDEEDKATQGSDSGVGVAESHDTWPTPPDKEDAMKWYVSRALVHNISYQIMSYVH